MTDVYVTRGLPGSGKSTWASRFVADSPNHYRLNMDSYRAMLGFENGSDLWTKEKEAVAFDLMLTSLVTMVRAGHNVVIDNCHIRLDWLKKYKKALALEDVTFYVRDFTYVSAESCIWNDSFREGPAQVGADVIKKMNRTLLDQERKGFTLTNEWMNDLKISVRKYEGTPGKPKAILVDLDGTLYEMGDRSPYAFYAVYKDTIKPMTHEAIKLFAAAGYAIVLASGRDGLYRDHTVTTLKRDKVFYDDLFMRPPHDTRSDGIVKPEMFWEHIAPNYDVELALDDRNMVVDVYRLMGLTTWQVAPGNF